MPSFVAKVRSPFVKYYRVGRESPSKQTNISISHVLGIGISTIIKLVDPGCPGLLLESELMKMKNIYARSWDF